MKIGIFLIATGKYDIFLQPLIDSLEKNFFPKDDLIIYLFTDKANYLRHSKRISIQIKRIEHKPFPYPTLYRYKHFSSLTGITADYCFYLDVDMLVSKRVDREILPFATHHEGLVVTLHPGFYRGGGGWCNNEKSLGHTPQGLRKRYYAGGFQGGETKPYLKMCKALADNIADDEERGIIATWHDESHLNRYMCGRTPRTLSPSYCMVEEPDLRVQWKITNFTPKIIALSKDHNALRGLPKNKLV